MKQKCVVRVDHREPETLKNMFLGNTNYEFANLAAGDFEFIVQDKIKLVIERKEVNDLSSSLIDGRFDSQKTKLSSIVSEYHDVIIAYIIEGDYDNHERQKAIETVLLTTPFRDGYYIIKTNNIKHTYTTITRLVELYEQDKLEPLNQDELQKRFLQSRTANRSTTNNNNWWTICLAQIPSVGPTAATCIATTYPSVQSLLAAYNALENDDDKKNMLKDLKLKNNRKIGPKMSEKIWQTICVQQEVSIEIEKPKPKKKTFIKKPKTKQEDECLFTTDDE